MNIPVDSRNFRHLIGLFATGVTIVATEVEGEPQGMTANAISSVSLEPLLMLVCIGNELPMAEFVKRTKNFSFNILREEQEPISNYFANMWEEDEPPPHEFKPWEGGIRLEGCIASIGCELHEILDGGDHRIVIGRVIALYKGEEPYHPLLFYGGAYNKLPPA